METKEGCWCVQVQNAYIDAKREGHAQRFAVAREKYIKVHEMELWNTRIITDIAELCIALELWDEAVSPSPSATHACLENIHLAGHLCCPPHTCALLDVPSACATDILCIPLELWDEAMSPSRSDMTVVACTLKGFACGCSIASECRRPGRTLRWAWTTGHPWPTTGARAPGAGTATSQAPGAIGRTPCATSAPPAASGRNCLWRSVSNPCSSDALSILQQWPLLHPAVACADLFPVQCRQYFAQAAHGTSNSSRRVSWCNHWLCA